MDNERKISLNLTVEEVETLAEGLRCFYRHLEQQKNETRKTLESGLNDAGIYHETKILNTLTNSQEAPDRLLKKLNEALKEPKTEEGVTPRLNKEEVELLTKHYVKKEREGTNTDEGFSIVLLGAFREYYELTERLRKVFEQLPTTGLKEHFIKNLEGVVEFGESVVGSLSSDKLNLMKEGNLQAEKHLKELLKHL